MRLSVIIPTIGRASLEDALRSCAAADEIIVVVDEAAGEVAELPDMPLTTRVEYVNGGDHGYTARTRGIELATGTHLAFMDDDDVYLPGAIDLMREHAADVPVIFRMDHYTHGILWREPVLEFGNVSTQMFVVPNEPGKLGVWAPHAPGLKEPGGDYTFLAGCVANMCGPVWREEIVAKLRPERPSITIVTPWLDHAELLPDYVAAVGVLSHRDAVMVVDNASEPPVALPGVRLDTNEGFAAASNRGLAAAATDAVLFLNNDVAMTRTDWLDAIRDALEPGVLVGAQLRYDMHGSVDGEPLPYLDGWCLAGMRDDLLELGGFDESFAEPSYYGDNDLCLRARAAGMTLREVRAGIAHKLNVTAGHGPDVRAATDANRARFVARVRELMGAAV